MNLEYLLEVTNPSKVQSVVLQMINEHKHQVTLPLSELNPLDMLQLSSKGYNIYEDEEESTITIFTDYDKTKLNTQNILNTQDDLLCETIPNVTRVRNYIIKQQLVDITEES